MSKKTVVITGSSRGIGRACAILFAKNNYNVVINYNKSKELAEELFNDLKEAGYSVDIFKADISNRFEANSLINHCIGKFGKIDVLINNAGISQNKLFTDITDDDWNEMMGTNLNGIFYTTQKALQYMLPECSGKIINISSIWGITGGSCEAHYSVSKAGLDAMTKSLAKELGPSNIRVNSIAPGIIDTSMNSHLSEEELQEIKQEIPLERIGNPNAISKCIKWLIEDDYTTGQIISVNGGWLI